MKITKLQLIGIAVLAEILLLIVSPLLEKLLPLFAVVSVWLWFILPGYLLTFIIRRPQGWLARVPLAFGLSVGFNAPFTILAILLRLSLWVFLLVSVIVFLLSVVLYYFFGTEPEKFLPDAGEAQEKALNYVRRVMLALLVIIVGILVYLALTWPPAGDDLAGLPLYTEVLAHDRIVGEEPFHGTGTPVTPRNELVVWGYQTILLCKMGQIDPALFLVYSRGVLIVVAFLAVAGFIEEWFKDRNFALLVSILWGLYLLGSLQFDGDGSNMVTRIFQDKFLGWFAIIPSLLVLFLWYVEEGRRAVLALLALGAFGIAMMHPVTFTILLILIAGYSLLHLIYHFSKAELLKFVWLALALGLCLVVPAIQFVRYMGPMPIEQAGLGGAVDFSRYRMAAGRFRLFLLESGGFVLHPKVITQQFVLLGLICSIFLTKQCKENRGTRLVVASLIMLSALLYLPLLAFLVGKFVTPFLIWRLAWPYSLLAIIAIAQFSLTGLRWVSGKLPKERTGQLLQPYTMLLIVAVGAVIAFPHISSGYRNLSERLAEERFSICAKAEGALAVAADLASETSINLLAGQKLNLCIPGTIGLANVIEYRGLGTVNRLPFEQIEASFQRVEDSDYFSSATRVDDRIMEMIENYRIEYVLVDRDRMSFELQFLEMPEDFELIYSDDEFSMFEVLYPLDGSLVVDGNAALRIADWDAAQTLFNIALRQDPEQLLAELGLADAYVGLGDYEAAREVLLQAEALFPDQAVIQIKLAETYLVLRNIPMAAKYYQNGRDLAPERAEIYYDLATTMLLLDDEQAGLSTYEAGAALFAQEGTAAYYQEIAKQLVLHRWYDEALPYFQQALQVAPTSGLYVDYAEALFQVGELDLALDACREAIRLDRWYYLPYFQLGKIYQSQNRLELAVEMYHHAIWLDPSDSNVYVSLAESLQELFGTEQAIAELEGMIRGSREMPGPLSGLIPLYIMQGNLEAALEQYELLGTLLPRSTSLEVARGFMLVNIGDYQQAQDLFLDVMGENPDLISPSMGMAKIYSLQGEPDGELEQRLLITQKIPLNAWPHISLAYAYNRLGQWEKAREEFEFAVELSPEWPAAHSALGDYYYSRGAWDLALEAYQSAMALGAEDATTYTRVAAVYWRLNELAAAEENLLHAIAFDPNAMEAYLDLTYLYWQQGLSGQSMAALDSLEALRLDSASEIAPIIEAYAMQGRLDEVARIYDEIVANGAAYADFPAWTNPEMPVDTNSDYALAVVEELEVESITLSTLLRGAAEFYLSQNQVEKAAAALQLNLALPPDEPLEYAALADFELLQGEHQAAIATINQGLEAFPDSSDLFNFLGETYLLIGEKELAENAFMTALGVDQDCSIACINMVKLTQASGDYQTAQAMLETKIAAYPTSFDLMMTLSAVYEAAGEFDRAEEVLLTAYDLSPTDVIVVLELAGFYQQRGRLDEAQNYLAQALSLEPSNSEVYLALGSFFEVSTDPSQALAAYQTAVNIDQASIRARLTLAEFYRKNGEVALAEAILREAIAVQPGNLSGHLALGSLLLQTLDLEGAQQSFETACAVDAINTDCLVGMGQVAVARAEYQTARAFFDRALSINPADGQGLIAAAELSRLQGDLQMAEALYNQAVESSTDTMGAIYTRAKFYQATGNFTAAEEDYLTAWQYWPGNVTIGLDYVRLLKQENKFDQALVVLDELVGIHSMTCSIGMELADVYIQGLAWEQALETYQDLISVDPGCVDAYQNLAKAQKALGEIDDTLSYYQDAISAVPANPRAYLNLGNAYGALMEFDNAEVAFNQALSLDPGNLNALLSLERVRLIRFQGVGFIPLDLGSFGQENNPDYLLAFAALYQEYNQWEIAAQYIQQVQGAALHDAAVWFALGSQYAHEMDWDQALSAFQNAVNLSPDDLEILLALGEGQFELGQLEQAEQTFRLITNLYPGKADGYLALADFYVQDMQLDQAEAILQECIDNAPADSRGYEALGRLYINTGEFGQVEPVFLAGLAAIPGAPNIFAGLGDYYSWGITGLVDEIHLAEATAWWYGYLIRRLATAEAPGPKAASALSDRRLEINRLYQQSLTRLAAVRNQLANASTDVEAARSAYLRSLELNPGNENALLGLARLEAETGNHEAALEYYQLAAAVNPNSTLSLNRLGFAYLEYEQPEAALPVFERSVSLDPEEPLSLLGRFRALVELGSWDVLHAARTTDSAQFWWGDLVDRLRVTAFVGTQLDPYAGVQHEIDPDQAAIEVDVPAGWTEDQTRFDYSVVRTFTSPDGKAVLQMVVYDDEKLVNRGLALEFALVLLHETYTGDLTIERNEILFDRENLMWYSPEDGYSGVTGFTVNQGMLVVLTYMYDTQSEEIYAELLADISNGISLGDPVYP